MLELGLPYDDANQFLACSQVWGFEKVDDTRYYVRHVLVRKGDDWKQARLVYDFIKK